MPVTIFMQFLKYGIYNGQQILQIGKNDIQYVNVELPVFQIQYYDIKSGKI